MNTPVLAADGSWGLTPLDTSLVGNYDFNVTFIDKALRHHHIYNMTLQVISCLSNDTIYRNTTSPDAEESI